LRLGCRSRTELRSDAQAYLRMSDLLVKTTTSSGGGDGQRHVGLSVIIPVAAGESAWRDLLKDLAELPASAEVLLAAVEPVPSDLSESCGRLPFRPRWLATRQGRAAQMNDATRSAAGEFVWFLHADTRLPIGTVDTLGNALEARPECLHYFKLRFFDGPACLKLNELGVALRCRMFGLPFGDQGFCLRRELFLQLGGFDEGAPYGEDHLLVCAAKRRGVALHQVGGFIATSGRKYAERGWLRTTARHVGLTLRQAVYEAHRVRRTPE
jgi:hypothetical protein